MLIEEVHVWNCPVCIIADRCLNEIELLNYDAFLSCRFVYFFANNADPDKLRYYALFHLDVHC